MYSVSETAQVELKRGRVQAPARYVTLPTGTTTTAVPVQKHSSAAM